MSTGDGSDVSIGMPEFLRERLRAQGTPFQEAALLEEDIVEDAIPVEKGHTGTEGDAAEAIPAAARPETRTLTSVTATAHLLAGERPYRQVVEIHSVGDALNFEISHDSGFSGSNVTVVPTASLPADFPVFEFQELWFRQTTAVNQRVSYRVEPKAEGR